MGAWMPPRRTRTGWRIGDATVLLQEYNPAGCVAEKSSRPEAHAVRGLDLNLFLRLAQAGWTPILAVTTLVAVVAVVGVAGFGSRRALRRWVVLSIAVHVALVWWGSRNELIRRAFWMNGTRRPTSRESSGSPWWTRRARSIRRIRIVDRPGIRGINPRPSGPWMRPSRSRPGSTTSRARSRSATIRPRSRRTPTSNPESWAMTSHRSSTRKVA